MESCKEPCSPVCSQKAPHLTQEITVKMEEPKTEKPMSPCGDIITLLSEDEIMDVTEESKMTSEEQRKGRVDKDGFHFTETLLRSMRTYCEGHLDFSNLPLDAIWSQARVKDLARVCSHSPYCLFLFELKKLKVEQGTILFLIGYLDQSRGIHLVRVLGSLKVATVEPLVISEALGKMLKETLGTALSNLSLFYSNCDTFESSLRSLSPSMISLCQLPDMLGKACLKALLGSFKGVVDFVGDINDYSSHSSASDVLKAIFAKPPVKAFTPIAENFLFLVRSIQRVVTSWGDLVQNFKSQGKQIKARLMDAQLKLRFLFLSEALEPLRDLAAQGGGADMATELQLTSVLLRCYAVALLRPSAATRFIQRPDVSLLCDEAELLPTAEVTFGNRVHDYLQAVTLGEEERLNFLKDVAAFYTAALESFTRSIPERFGDVVLRNINSVHKFPEDVKLSGHVMSDMGAELGLCEAASAEARQLEDDYPTLVKLLEEHRGRGAALCWANTLAATSPGSVLRRLLLMLLALPSSLNMKQLLVQVFTSARVLTSCQSEEEVSKTTSLPPSASPQTLHRPGNLTGFRDKEKNETHGKSLWDLSDTDASDTDNSSDVIDITPNVEKSPPSKTRHGSSVGVTIAPSPVIHVMSSEDDDVEVVSKATSSARQFSAGELVWGQLESYALWPAVVLSYQQDSPDRKMVSWYGRSIFCQVSKDTLKPFGHFTENFCPRSFRILDSYKKAIELSLQEAALRCKKTFSSSPHDGFELMKLMLDWAFGGFQPTGPNGFKPVPLGNGVTEPHIKQQEKRKSAASSVTDADVKEACISFSKLSPHDSSDQSTPKSTGKRKKMKRIVKVNSSSRKQADQWEQEEDEWGKGKGGRRRSKAENVSWGLLFDSDPSPDHVPKRRSIAKYNKVTQSTSSTYTQPDQKLREETIESIVDMDLDIEGFCLCCGSENVEIFHPLFKGGLCLECKDNFTETLYRYDDDGYQSYCTICCYGMEVILCGNDGCCRSYCKDCLDTLIGRSTFDLLKDVDPWICYLCQDHRAHRALIPREDWSIKVQQFFANNSAMEFEPHRVYPSIPANLRRPLRVLSLFDGIGTGYLVLKDLGFKIETYVASEICEDSIAVATVNHDKKINHVGDTRDITKQLIEKWGPFDLLIGGSPCNDLSIVNPNRKGIYEGSGRLFFDYYRILQLLKPKEEDNRPFFWLFENVVFMNVHDKVNICRFLECNPVLVDAVKVSPAHRARYFWGNIPGMSRPTAASQSDKLNLQDCLEVGREARVTKVRTITSNLNSLKQGKSCSLLPVLCNGKEDNLWITELEKIFGFPKHYTDVRNMSRQKRQKVLGKSWSVPVIRHLFAPLKDYFACEELTPLTSVPSTCVSLPSFSPLR
ncbi:uncharacterized protein LOC129181785 [Dunckerocampus dactyliophorus]|uniref:uncharacterized protein LOC129181785 n=1 Tax=Dunckerocampus dactyliophorus TaxID=161453 RepID=UPI0024066A13|nr:uncharacterized protein LOC129181785 [Dunckerocampus dactyliophorus]